MIHRPLFAVLVLALSVVVAGCGTDDDPAPAPAAGTSSESPAPAAEVAQGRWWAWAAAEPEGRDPVSDPTGAHCGRNQPTGVWFLAGTFGGEVERRCAVPAGRPLLAPAVNRFSESASDCADFMATATGEVLVDDTPVTLDRVAGDRIEFTGVAGNAIGTGTDRVRATACGLWARVPGLPAGTHRVRISGHADGIDTAVDYTLEVS